MDLVSWKTKPFCWFSKHGNSTVLKIAVMAAIIGVVNTNAAFAGTDTTFNTTVTQLTSWTEGSLGKLTGVAGVATALIGMVMKFDWRLIAGAAGIGLTAATGPSIVSGLASALF